jgi:hypothetical protein
MMPASHHSNRSDDPRNDELGNDELGNDEERVDR